LTLRAPKACPPKPGLRSRPLLTPEQANGLANVFRILANDTRLRLLHVLARQRDACVGELARQVGMAPQAVSNQLQRLQDARVVASRRDGNSIYYRIVDRCVVILLDRGWCLLEESDKRRSTRQVAALR
jgi:ArsR family transcriptional regulator, lead/cadmium/zinc/bismuth-responsive transcriptional repressor